MTTSVRSTFVVACFAAVLLVACGGEQETRTIVETVTREQPPAPGPDQPAPPGQDPALEPLPPGVVGADGTYAMTVRDADAVGGGGAVDITEDDTALEESQWTFSTSCTGPECEIEMRRELQSGGSKSLTLTPAEGREGVFEADSTGTTECGDTGGTSAPSDQRYSIKLNAPQDIGGRQTATRIEAYFTEDTDGCRDTASGESRPASGTVSWTGVLAP
jgi:major membrane immunogen (membrane-anchored lipoprotein)